MPQLTLFLYAAKAPQGIFMIYDSITQLIGNTPLLRLNSYAKSAALKRKL